MTNTLDNTPSLEMHDGWWALLHAFSSKKTMHSMKKVMHKIGFLVTIAQIVPSRVKKYIMMNRDQLMRGGRCIQKA
jgi:Flp pilus assembly CpaF family ATPase